MDFLASQQLAGLGFEFKPVGNQKEITQVYVQCGVAEIYLFASKHSRCCKGLWRHKMG